MTAFLKIDKCKTCHRILPWEYTPAVVVNGRALAGTAVWRSQLVNDRCDSCRSAIEDQQYGQRINQFRHKGLIELLGGEKPVRDFTFDRYQITAENHIAYESARQFTPAAENLYLWGPCGVGKTHLAWAAARLCFEETLSVIVVSAFQLSRRVRMKDPEQEQAAIDRFITSDVLVLDDLGAGSDTAFTRQVLQEILDGRIFDFRDGLIVTSSYDLDSLARKLDDDTIPSRLAGICKVIKVQGLDYRLVQGSQ